MTLVWTGIAVVALVSMVIKAAGPAILGDRRLPDRVTSVIALLAAALLAGLIAVGVLGAGWGGVSWSLLAGLATVALARWLRVPDLAAIVLGVTVTALLRLALPIG
jgi:branched-subunit amino acid transport protein